MPERELAVASNVLHHIEEIGGCGGGVDDGLHILETQPVLIATGVAESILVLGPRFGEAQTSILPDVEFLQVQPCQRMANEDGAKVTGAPGE